MAKELIYKDDARRAILKANPSIAFCIDNVKTVNVGQEWISVKDRLPEKNTSVLVYYKDGRNIFWYDSKDGFCDIDQYGCNDPIDSVTHWMPLPEPPKGE